jgi:hypothetical protein
MKNLKFMVLGLGLLIGNVQADVIKLAEDGYPERFNYDVKAVFVVNSEPARAWVELTYTEIVSPFSDRTPDEETRRVKLPGLKYDPASKEISLSSAAGEIVCARLTERGFPFRYEAAELTEACSFNVENTTMEVTRDDGFKTWTEEGRVIRVELRVNER